MSEKVNTCRYKCIVKGRENACRAFFGSMRCLDEEEKKITQMDMNQHEWGTMHFTGTCGWPLNDSCSDEWEGNCPVELPEAPEEAEKEGREKYMHYTLRERSRMFGIEVLCCWADIDEPFGNIFEYFEAGVPGTMNCPPELYVLEPEPGMDFCPLCHSMVSKDELDANDGFCALCKMDIDDCDCTGYFAECEEEDF